MRTQKLCFAVNANQSSTFSCHFFLSLAAHFLSINKFINQVMMYADDAYIYFSVQNIYIHGFLSRVFRVCLFEVKDLNT